MKVYALTYNGCGYGEPYADQSTEFASIADAVECFRRQEARAELEEGAWMRLYARNPADATDPYPFAELTIGPRGSVRRQLR